MESTQPIIVPAMVRIPQLSPQQIAEKRLQYTIPAVIPPAKPQPISQPPQRHSVTGGTPLPVSPSLPGVKRPPLRYIPRKTKRKEPGVGETLLGCGILILIAILGLALFYFLALGT